MRSFVGLLLLCVISSCKPGGEPIVSNRVAALAPASERLPSVEALFTVSAPEGASNKGPFALGDRGDVLLPVAGAGNEPRLVLIDPSGKEAVRFARTGSGPGEVRTPGGVWIDGDRLVVFDGLELRLNLFDREGHPLSTVPPSGVTVPFSVTGDTVRAIRLGDDGHQTYVGIVIGGGEFPLIDPSDTMLKSFFDRDEQPRPLGRAYVGGRLVLGDPTNFTLVWFTENKSYARVTHTLPEIAPSPEEVEAERERWRRWRGPDGKVLSAPDIESRIAEWRVRPRAPFAHPYGLGLDGAGRLWVWLDQGGPVRALIFSDGRYLGEIAVHCAGASRSWAVRRDRLAALCEREDGTLELRQWHIRDSATSEPVAR